MADSLYWIGRYVERAEDTARITHVNYQHTLGMGTSPEAESRRRRQWEALVTIVGDAPRFRAEHDAADEDTVPPYLTFDPSNPNSIITCIASAREQARTMRHQIASEMWEALNRFHLDLQRRVEQHHGTIDADEAYPFYRSIVDFSHLFQGITDSTMPREEGWFFLQAGKFLERAEKTARALDVKYHLLVADADPAAPVTGPGFSQAAADLTPEDGVLGEWHQWLAVLRSLSAYEAYHKIYRSRVRPRSVVEMLLLSPAFPRSIRFAIEEVDTALARIAVDCAPLVDAEGLGGNVTTGGPTEAERAVGRLRSQLAYQRVEEVFDAGLHEYLLDLQRRCYDVGERIHAQYFAHRVLRAEEVLAS